jgi:hypothetical protein
VGAVPRTAGRGDSISTGAGPWGATGVTAARAPLGRVAASGTCSSAVANAAAEAKRCPGSLAMACSTAASSSSEKRTSGAFSASRGGGVFRCIISTSTDSSAWNGFSPVSISNRTTPQA